MDQVFIIQLRSDRLGNASTTAKTRTICSSLPSSSSSTSSLSSSSSSLSSPSSLSSSSASLLSRRSTRRSTTSSSSSCTVNAYVKRQPNPKKSISLHWIVLIWLAAVLPSSLKYHAYGLDELHIGGIFPIGGKGGWVSHK